MAMKFQVLLCVFALLQLSVEAQYLNEVEQSPEREKNVQEGLLAPGEENGIVHMRLNIVRTILVAGYSTILVRKSAAVAKCMQRKASIPAVAISTTTLEPPNVATTTQFYRRLLTAQDSKSKFASTIFMDGMISVWDR
ncbi:Hypothetical predicted protein [Paramuricea clavata]|uniref:Uncharacterized protein n=1 Tax=Paramuricea clavata TaxID=317549 RepID=A0A6S7G6V8_PARCT|nr:Hypothetical predicted protein [Paramuricea clavata]